MLGHFPKYVETWHTELSNLTLDATLLQHNAHRANQNKSITHIGPSQEQLKGRDEENIFCTTMVQHSPEVVSKAVPPITLRQIPRSDRCLHANGHLHCGTVGDTIENGK